MSDKEKVLATPKNDDIYSLANNPEESLPESNPKSGEAPNGGFGAWLQVGGSFCLYFNTW